ncbi:putative autophagy-related protein 11 isoform X2 [Tachysurus ichikawai]
MAPMMVRTGISGCTMIVNGVKLMKINTDGGLGAALYFLKAGGVEHKVVNGILQFVETKARKREKFLLRKKKGIQESLDEAEENYREAMDRVTELENENIDRVAEVHTLQDEMTHLLQNLSDTQMMFERTMRDLEQKSRQFTELKSKWELLNETVLKDYQVECQAHKVLKVQYSEMKEQRDKLHEDHVRVSEDYSILQSQYEELKQHHGSLMVTVAEEKYALLYSEKSELISHVNKEQCSVQHLEEELTETRRKCDEISRREREDYDLLKVQYKEMEETLQQCKELLKCNSTYYKSTMWVERRTWANKGPRQISHVWVNWSPESSAVSACSSRVVFGGHLSIGSCLGGPFG